jgi:hypothetical protein
MRPPLQQPGLGERQQQREDQEDDGDRGPIGGAEEGEAVLYHRVEQHLRGFGGPALGQDGDGVEHLKAADRGDRHDEDQRRPQQRPGDAAEALEGAVGAVQRQRLVEVLRDRGDARHEQHHGKAEILPRPDRGEREQREVRVVQPVLLREAEQRDRLVHEADARMQHKLPDQRHPQQGRGDRQEIGRAIERAPARRALDQQRGEQPEDDRRRQGDADIDHRVAQAHPEDPVAPELGVVAEPVPGHLLVAHRPVREGQQQHRDRGAQQHRPDQQEGGRRQQPGGERLGPRAGPRAGAADRLGVRATRFGPTVLPALRPSGRLSQGRAPGSRGAPAGAGRRRRTGSPAAARGRDAARAATLRPAAARAAP